MRVAGRTWLRVAGVLALLAAGAMPAGAQGSTGTVTGRIVEEGSGQGINEVQLSIVGTTIGGRTDAQGNYTIRGVPVGAQRLRANRIGYGERTVPVTVAAGQTLTQNVALSRTPVVLQEVVTTATGEQRRVELGNAVSTIQTADVVKTAPVQQLSDVINSRAPGVVVTGGTQTGVGARIRIRGQSSLSLSNDPIYVIDGVRMTSNSGSSNLFTGGAQPSRVGDLNPEEIESIEIVKGPSAATLYGTDAANGVIVITTKRGRAGPARWSAWAEGGIIEDRNDYPLNYTIAGHAPATPTVMRTCTLPQVSAGTCVMDSVRTYSPLHDADATPIGTGNRYQYGLQVSGGTEALRYFISGEQEEETGLLELPGFERRRLAEQGLPIPEHVERPNALEKRSFRVNLGAAVNPKLDINVNTGYVNVDQRYSLESNATAGLGSHLFGGPGYKDNGVVGGGLGTPLTGYRAWTPGYTWQEKAGQRVNRFIGGLNANFRPLSWLVVDGRVGLDYTARVDDNLLRRGEGPPITATYRLGFKENTRTNLRNFSTDLSSAATFQPRPWLNSKTTVGVQYVNYQLDQNVATGEDLAPGTQTAGAGADQSSSEATTLTKTLGFFVEEQVGFNDRLFLTAALRSDQNSAFGTDFQSVLYPKFAVSWIASDEPFFPELGWLDQFRFRASYGSSGVQPGPNDALRTFSDITANVEGADVPGVVFAELGNTELKPERSTEFETGFEVSTFGNRATLDVTWYRKRTKDALIDAIVPPSLGAAGDVRRNLGAVQNQGWEVLLTTQLLDRPAIGWDVTINGSTNANKLLSLGGTPPQVGTTTQVQEGYPLYGFWGNKITGWQDKNNDGILTYNADPALNEVFVEEEDSFLGYVQPRHNVSLTNGVELFGRRLRLSALFDYRGGNLWYNNTERIRCVSRQNCNGLMNPEASFEEQAMVVATRDHPTRSLAGFLQKGDFVRFRELSATFALPQSWLSRVGGVQNVSLNLSARNLAVWTDYRGVDPETDRDAGSSDDTPDEFQTVGPPSYFILRVNVGF